MDDRFFSYKINLKSIHAFLRITKLTERHIRVFSYSPSFFPSLQRSLQRSLQPLLLPEPVSSQVELMMRRNLRNTFFPRFERFNRCRTTSLKTAVSDLLRYSVHPTLPQCALVTLWDWLFLKALAMYFCLGSTRVYDE